jgi:hypothetical protein
MRLIPTNTTSRVSLRLAVHAARSAWPGDPATCKQVMAAWLTEHGAEMPAVGGTSGPERSSHPRYKAAFDDRCAGRSPSIVHRRQITRVSRPAMHVGCYDAQPLAEVRKRRSPCDRVRGVADDVLQGHK